MKTWTTMSSRDFDDDARSSKELGNLTNDGVAERRDKMKTSWYQPAIWSMLDDGRRSLRRLRLARVWRRSDGDEAGGRRLCTTSTSREFFDDAGRGKELGYSATTPDLTAVERRGCRRASPPYGVCSVSSSSFANGSSTVSLKTVCCMGGLVRWAGDIRVSTTTTRRSTPLSLWTPGREGLSHARLNEIGGFAIDRRDLYQPVGITI